MTYFVELPADEYGNRAYTNSFPCVVEANEIIEHDRPYLKFVAPPEIASKWPRVLKNAYGGWFEVPGPARPLTWEEREKLISEQLGLSR